MATQLNIYSSDAVGAIPSALLVLMTILALLGIIANVAMA
jgi:hypothetical protein